MKTQENNLDKGANPGDPIWMNDVGWGTIVAFTCYSDEAYCFGPVWTTLILKLHPPYFRIALIDEDKAIIDHVGDFFNIVEAVEEYQQWGGDI